MKLVTLSRVDPLCEKYLLGSFSKEERAIPIQSLNVNTESEQITFRLEPVAGIARPWFYARWAVMLRAHHLVLVFFPIFAVLAKNWLDETLFTPLIATSSSLAALFLMVAVNFRNDSMDHLKGLDRIHPSAGSRALQKGWVTAQYLLRLSIAFLTLGILFGLPAIYVHPEVLFLLAGLAGLGLFGMTSYKMGLKYRRWSEMTVFLLLGPMLTIGLQISCGSGFDLESLLLGIVTGWFAVFVLHLQNFQLLMVHDQAGFQNTVTWLGFEKGKRLLAVWWGIFLVTFLCYHWFFAKQAWFFFYLILAAGSVGLTLWQLKMLKTTVGSRLKNVVQVLRSQGFVFLTLWSLEWVIYLWGF